MNDFAAVVPSFHAAFQDKATPGHQPAPDATTLIRLSGLFDEIWYRHEYPGVCGADEDALAHFAAVGWREGLSPNLYFDTQWYLTQNPDVARSGVNPIIDYILRGERMARAPSPLFDLLWFRTCKEIAPRDTYLRCFLAECRSGTVSPLPEFDPQYYLATYHDIAQAGVDPFEHYYRWGYKEGRNPSPDFDTQFYVQRHLDGDLSRNPLLHYRQFRHVLHLATKVPDAERAVSEEVRRFTRPGPEFERHVPLPSGAERRAKVLAYYLPQFHSIPENDQWWGDGFTEWTSVARGQPRYLDHYQPRCPRDLGHYTLDNTATMRRQIEMAQGAGVFGFVMHYYCFNGHRLLERPLEAFLQDPSLDFPFCLMWANENWTRRWDGSDSEVLIAQNYRPEDDVALVDDFARHFRDSRYIRVGRRPVLMVYRPRLIPNTRQTVQRWMRLFEERHGETPLLIMAQSFDEADPRPLGFDAAIEFPPHKLVKGLPQRSMEYQRIDPKATLQIFAYGDVVNASLSEPIPPYPLIKTVVPGWDNDARRQGAGLVLHGATPEMYETWLKALVDRAVADPPLGEPFVCVNAWNEWAEGAYLEPDVHFGAAFANATARAVSGRRAGDAGGRVLLIGHDAFPAGAQMLLLHLGRSLRRQFGVTVEFILLGGGDLQAQYEAVAPVTLAQDDDALRSAVRDAAARGFGCAIVNTAAAAGAASVAAQAGLRVTLLIHEMARILRERQLLAVAASGAAAASRVVFAAEAVAVAFTAEIPLAEGRARILPQGCYRPVARNPDAGTAARVLHAIAPDAPLLIAAGTGDLRKGFDLFLQTWRALRRIAPRAVCCWLGTIDPALAAWLEPEIDAAKATGTFLVPGFCADVGPWLSATDVLLLPSREDPFPSVVLEALSAGVPVVAFAGSGGAPEVIERLDAGRIVAMGDSVAMAEAAANLAAARDETRAARLTTAIRTSFEFADYARALLHEAHPALASVSVVVPSCDYARFLPGRLGSIFSQSLPITEVVILDDASTDDSVTVAHDTARDWQRDITIEVTDTRTGSPFGQWRRAAEAAKGEWLWIAEADDAAHPTMLAKLAEAIGGADDIVLAACDSRSIDEAGGSVWPNYQSYYADSDAGLLSGSFTMPALEFARRFLAERNLLLNVSAVLWRRNAFAGAIARCADLPSWQVAGDWRIYLEVLAGTDGRVAWIADPLNVHRRHAASASGRSPGAHLGEITRMHALARSMLALGPVTLAKQKAYRDKLAASLARSETPAKPRSDKQPVSGRARSIRANGSRIHASRMATQAAGD